jgi:hypothetical protein
MVKQSPLSRARRRRYGRDNHEKRRRLMTDPTFTIEDDAVGLGFCIVAVWPEGRREASQWSDAGSEPVPEDCRDGAQE